jgi:hypothetical protein
MRLMSPAAPLALSILRPFSFVDVQSEYIDQVLNRMSGSIIRSRDLRIRVATPKEKETTRDSRRFKPKGKKTFTKGQKRVRKH